MYLNSRDLYECITTDDTKPSIHVVTTDYTLTELSMLVTFKSKVIELDVYTFKEVFEETVNNSLLTLYPGQRLIILLKAQTGRKYPLTNRLEQDPTISSIISIRHSNQSVFLDYYYENGKPNQSIRGMMLNHDEILKFKLKRALDIIKPK